MLKRDSLPLGIILGFLAPVFGFFAYYFLQFRMFTLSEFFQVLMMQKTLITGVVSLSLIANAIVFTIYINLKKDQTAKGVFVATCIYAIIALLIKLFA
ncbi:MAG: hypothetical protein JWQ96_2994 [Segetibacter sp.]|nr:hypothetical protein [Segetibacter sp.]